jgi:hypothetical protein
MRKGAFVIRLAAKEDLPPSAQGLGVGRLLMEFAEQLAVRRRLDRLALYTNEIMTENISLYSHLGYVEVDRHIEDGYRRVFMEKRLISHPGDAQPEHEMRRRGPEA